MGMFISTCMQQHIIMDGMYAIFMTSEIQQKMWKYLRNEECLKANVINSRASLMLRAKLPESLLAAHELQQTFPECTQGWQIFAHFYAAFWNCIWWRMRILVSIPTVDLIKIANLQLCLFIPFDAVRASRWSCCLGQLRKWSGKCVQKEEERKRISGSIVINVPFCNNH